MIFQPAFSLTPKLLNNITKIERLYGQLEGLRLPKKLELNLRRNNLVQSSYISNSIEGNPLSLVEVTNLLLNDRIPANRDEQEIKNYFDLLRSLGDRPRQPLKLEVVVDLHQKLLADVNDKIAGHIRNTRVVIGRYVAKDNARSFRVKHEPPFHRREEIEHTIKELLDWAETNIQIPAVVKIGIFHHQFVYIHPFEDGNGRVCRLLTALLFLHSGYLINKYFVLDDYYDIDRIQYSDTLHTADSGDKTEWLEYFTDGVKYSLQSALAKAQNALRTLQREEQPTTKEKEALKIFDKEREITSTELARHLRVSRQRAHSLLQSLVKKGLVDYKGSTKSRYYFLM